MSERVDPSSSGSKTPSEPAATPILPAHIEQTIRAIARLHADHYEGATRLQRTIERVTARAGRPEFVGVLTVLVVGWIAFNGMLAALGQKPIDEPPFFWLQGAVGLAALYMAIFILTTQRREDELASHRAQLTLELGILGEQKAAKIIELLEDLRRDAPDIPDRVDREALAMASPADPQTVLDAIKDTHQDMLSTVAGTSDTAV